MDTVWLVSCLGGCGERLKRGPNSLEHPVCRVCRARGRVILCEYCDMPFRSLTGSLTAKYCSSRHFMLDRWKTWHLARELEDYLFAVSRTLVIFRQVSVTLDRVHQVSRSAVNQPLIGCSDEGCLDTLALGLGIGDTGWDLVEGEAYCPLHRQEAARRALAAAETRRMQERINALRRERNEKLAKTGLSAAEYRAWDEFQGDLVNFHRDHGKLAPVQLRTLDPVRWRAIHTEKGRIDVEAEAEGLFQVEQAAQRTRDWLMNR